MKKSRPPRLAASTAIVRIEEQRIISKRGTRPSNENCEESFDNTSTVQHQSENVDQNSSLQSIVHSSDLNQELVSVPPNSPNSYEDNVVVEDEVPLVCFISTGVDNSSALGENLDEVNPKRKKKRQFG